MKRIFLPSAKFLQQHPTAKEIQEVLAAPVENTEEEDVMEVVTNEFPEVKTTSKKKKKKHNK